MFPHEKNVTSTYNFISGAVLVLLSNGRPVLPPLANLVVATLGLLEGSSCHPEAQMGAIGPRRYQFEGALAHDTGKLRR